jgi:hypothetical protein
MHKVNQSKPHAHQQCMSNGIHTDFPTSTHTFPFFGIGKGKKKAMGECEGKRGLFFFRLSFLSLWNYLWFTMKSTRLQDKRMTIDQECDLYACKWPADAHVQVLDSAGRVLQDLRFTEAKVECSRGSSYTVHDSTNTLSLRIYKELGMYTARLNKAKEMGKFMDKYIFLVVNHTLLTVRSDYEEHEKDHQQMRKELIAKVAASRKP